MIGAKEYLQVKFLRTLEPLSSLSIDKLEEIANKSQVEELPAGRIVFRQGEKDPRCIYLLSGQLELQVTGNPRAETLKAKSAETRHPVSQEWPRPCTCRTKTSVVLLTIDSALLEILLSDDASGRYEVAEIGVEEDAENDWMLRFLQSPAFLRLPTDNIQKLLMQLEEVPVTTGQVIVRQGDTDSWYYIVKQGKCVVSRRPAPKAEEVRLAVLGPGDGFGEEALISHGKRNANVIARDDGVLMRLDKDDFHALLVEPMLVYIDHQSMMEKVKAGAALIDVRSNKEFTENGIKGALNIPLSMLRLKAKDLNSTREHIVYCNDANLSSAAAFLMGQQSIQVYVLEGGLDRQQKAFSPAASAAASVTQTAPAQSTPVAPPVLDNVVENPPPDEIFHEHKRQAQHQAQRASEAESAHKQAEAKTAQLRQEADALRAQASQLANKTASAEAVRRKAEAELQAREQERARKSQQEISRLKQEAEQARRRAETELARIKSESEAVNRKRAELDSEFKRAESEKQQAARAAEVARIIAKQEAEKVKAEAEAIRQNALQEAERLKQEMASRKAKMVADDAQRHEAAVEEAKRKAEAAIQEAARAADEARRQAEMEANLIRKQAQEEAERMRRQLEHERQQAAEASARAKAEEQLRIDELDSLRQQAMDEARRQIEREAESLRQKTYEEVQRQAMQTARFQAEQAAEAIRREALEEANRLRQELESTRQMVESETLRARTRMEEDAARLDEEDEALARAAEESARRATENAERRRAEEARRRLEEEVRRAEQARREREEQQRRAQEEELARAYAEEQQRLAEEEREQARALEAEQKARALQQRLAESNARKQSDEFVYATGDGPKLSRAKVHVSKDKTILEGEEDIFVFKAPSESPPTKEQAEKLLREAEAQFREKKDLPSFEIQYVDAETASAPKQVTDAPEFSDSIVQDLGDLTASTGPQTQRNKSESEMNFSLPEDMHPRQKRRSKGSLIALAATIVLMIGVSIFVISRPSYINKNTLSNLIGGNEEQQSDSGRGLASMRASTESDSREVAETRVKAEADAEFNQLLSQWRRNNSK